VGELGKQGAVVRIHPSNVAIYVMGTNRRSVESRIYSYDVEGQTVSGKWVKLVPLTSVGCTPFLVFPPEGLRKAYLVNIKMLDRELAFRMLKPGEGFEGLAVFEYPKETAGQRFTMNFRFTIRELRGETSEAEFKTTGSVIGSSPSDLHLQGAWLMYLGNADLSSLQPEYMEH
jgi:hypothetical protein